jgi:nitroreductase
MNFKEIVMKRYATKSFDGRTIPEEKFRELEEIIRHSASSYNLQPWKFVIVRDKETKEKLLPFAWNQPQITTCSHLIVMCADTDLESKIKKLEEKLVESGVPKEKIDSLIEVISGFVKSMSKSQRLVWAQKQVYIALSNAINGAKELGFDSCPMEGFVPKDFSKILKLPKHIVPTVVVPVGYANDTPRPKIRFSRDEVFQDHKK